MRLRRRAAAFKAVTKRKPVLTGPTYLRQAAACLEAANQMSLSADRERMTQIAQRWFDLASAAEAEAVERP